MHETSVSVSVEQRDGRVYVHPLMGREAVVVPNARETVRTRQLPRRAVQRGHPDYRSECRVGVDCIHVPAGLCRHTCYLARRGS